MSRKGSPITWKRIVVLVVVLGGIYALKHFGVVDLTGSGSDATTDSTTTTARLPQTPPPARPGGAATSDGSDLSSRDRNGLETLRAAFRGRRSDVIVETAGVVDRLLPDDNIDSRHQRFIVRLDGDFTILIAHNIDLAPRVPIEAGDRIRFKGEYEWTERGGTVHWTHHDPGGRHPDGWIEVEGRKYG